MIKPGDTLGDQELLSTHWPIRSTISARLKPHNLLLEVKHVTCVTTVAELLAAIITRYRESGFEVTG